MKRYLCIGLLLVLCLGMVACGQIEDTNGADDYSLVTITNKDLVGSGFSSKTMTARLDINGKIEYSVGKFSGVEAVEVVHVKQGASRVTFAVNTTLESGNLYVYVRHNGQIVGEFAIGQNDTVTLENPPAGKYELCTAGESAKFKLVIEITQN